MYAVFSVVSCLWPAVLGQPNRAEEKKVDDKIRRIQDGDSSLAAQLKLDSYSPALHTAVGGSSSDDEDEESNMPLQNRI